MEFKESFGYNLIKSDNNNNRNKYIFLEDKSNREKKNSKTDFIKNIKFSSIEIKKKLIIEPLELNDNKENDNSIINNINTINKEDLHKSQFIPKKNNSKNNKDYKADQINNAINSINLKINSSMNANLKSIKINRKNKTKINLDSENNSILSSKLTDKNNSTLRKIQNSIDSGLMNRKIYLYTNRNKPQLKTLPNNNTDIHQNINLNIYNTIKQNNKIILSSLKLNSKSKTLKINNSSSNIIKSTDNNNFKKRYNSVQHISPKNGNLKVNRTILGNTKKLKKSFSFKKNKNLNDNKNINLITFEKKNKNLISSKEQIIEEKINELNIETLKFREERIKIHHLKLEYEKLQSQLFKDIDDFTHKKEEFEKFKQNEIGNINKERKNLLLDNKNIINLKNQNKSLEIEIKKNEEIISQLKMQISELQSIIKTKDIEIKNLQKIINDKQIYKKVTSINKAKEIKIGEEKINTFSNINKKNNSVKIFNTNDKGNNFFNSNTFMAKKLTKNNKYNLSISNNNSVLGRKKSNNLFKKNKYSKEKDFKNISKINLDTSNHISNKTSLIINPYFTNETNGNNISYNIKSREELDNNISVNSKYNNSKNESIKSIKNSFFFNNYTIKNYQNKNMFSKITINPIQSKCKLKKNLKNSIKTDFINKRINKKNYKTNTSYSKVDMEEINKDNISINNKTTENKINEANNCDDIKINEQNNNYDFVIPEKYFQLESNDNNKIIKILNINGNNIAIYSNNKKVITYPDGKKQIIYDDNHQIIYYNNGNKEQIFNNGKTVFYDNIDKKVETSYGNGIKIIKYKNGNIERFLDDNKENKNSNFTPKLNLNSFSNDNIKSNDINQKVEKAFIYNNKYKTIQNKKINI